MKAINLKVDDSIADKIEKLSEERKEQLSRMIELWVLEPKPILQVMEELGEYAAQKGITKEKLNDLLADE